MSSATSSWARPSNDVADVIDLATARAERTPHTSGDARCLRCDHRWVQVQPAGDAPNGMECPSCHCMTGSYVYLFRPPDGVPFLTCNCGNQHFLITEKLSLCANCGHGVPMPPPGP